MIRLYQDLPKVRIAHPEIQMAGGVKPNNTSIIRVPFEAPRSDEDCSLEKKRQEARAQIIETINRTLWSSQKWTQWEGGVLTRYTSGLLELMSMMDDFDLGQLAIAELRPLTLIDHGTVPASGEFLWEGGLMVIPKVKSWTSTSASGTATR